MRVLLQRVRQASVTVAGETVGSIGRGILLFLGVTHGDTRADADWLAKKAAGLRIFEDEAGKMNRSLLDVGGGALVVSQFTLYADCRKGRRPGFDLAGDPAAANDLYEYFAERLKAEGVVRVETGRFGADMLVSLENDGPATFLLSHPWEYAVTSNPNGEADE
ncbi:MAG: D-tyrosyl-tRNA(Tyr) deacylase [Lentisphaeria bacterium]|jgi:D-tyrosyl-tRNA(Tyr) deacylase|nr:D-tyrosyl-tRNA(Tyr) deacylase [Lentisphaeria bacterium]